VIGALRGGILRELRDQYPSAWALAGELAAIWISLMVYWYTARAFGAAFSTMNYFEYVLLGEVALFVPLVLFEGIARNIRRSASDGTLDALLVMPVRSQTPSVLFGMSLVPKELLRGILILALGAACFALELRPSRLALVLLLQLAAIPAFLGLGLMAAAFVVLFGRGDRVLSFVGMVAAICAGAYFPTSVLPEAVRSAGEVFSPFTALLGATRAVFSEGSPITGLGVLVFWDALALPLGYLLLGASFEVARRRGSTVLP
jgi:ABC-2 type transport system permease protein